MSVMKAPITKLVRTLAEPHAKLVRVIGSCSRSKASNANSLINIEYLEIIIWLYSKEEILEAISANECDGSVELLKSWKINLVFLLLPLQLLQPLLAGGAAAAAEEKTEFNVILTKLW